MMQDQMALFDFLPVATATPVKAAALPDQDPDYASEHPPIPADLLSAAPDCVCGTGGVYLMWCGSPQGPVWTAACNAGHAMTRGGHTSPETAVAEWVRHWGTVNA